MTPEQIASLVSLGWAAKDLGAIAGLGFVLWLLLSGRVVTRRHMDEVVEAVVKSKDVQVEEAKIREREWHRLATRGADDIIAPLASAVRHQLGAGERQEQPQ